MWQINIVKIIRAIIGDVNCGPSVQEYSDQRLASLAIIAAYQVYGKLTFQNSYTINISNNTISPDPFTLDDKSFNILVAYKAASILLNSEIKVQAASSVAIKDGPSSINLAGMGRELQAAAKLISDSYNELEFEYKRADSSEAFSAIISPYYMKSFLLENYEDTEQQGEVRWQ